MIAAVRLRFGVTGDVKNVRACRRASQCRERGTCRRDGLRVAIAAMISSTSRAPSGRAAESVAPADGREIAATLSVLLPATSRWSELELIAAATANRSRR